MKATTQEIRHAFIMGSESKSAGFTTIAQDSEFLMMLQRFAGSFDELCNSYFSGKK